MAKIDGDFFLTTDPMIMQVTTQSDQDKHPEGALPARTRAECAPMARSAPEFRCCLPGSEQEHRAGIQLTFSSKHMLHGLGVFISIPHPTDLTEKDLLRHVHKTVKLKQRSEQAVLFPPKTSASFKGWGGREWEGKLTFLQSSNFQK